MRCNDYYVPDHVGVMALWYVQFGALRSNGHWFKTHSSRHVGTLGSPLVVASNALACSLQHSINAVVGSASE